MNYSLSIFTSRQPRSSAAHRYCTISLPARVCVRAPEFTLFGVHPREHEPESGRTGQDVGSRRRLLRFFFFFGLPHSRVDCLPSLCSSPVFIQLFCSLSLSRGVIPESARTLKAFLDAARLLKVPHCSEIAATLKAHLTPSVTFSMNE